MADALGADVEQVRRGIGTDPRIGPYFLYAGDRLRHRLVSAPKDLRGLACHMAQANGSARGACCPPWSQVNEPARVSAAGSSNPRRWGKRLLADRLAGRCVAVWAPDDSSDIQSEAPQSPRPGGGRWGGGGAREHLAVFVGRGDPRIGLVAMVGQRAGLMPRRTSTPRSRPWPPARWAGPVGR